jgi:large repetitive protein
MIRQSPAKQLMTWVRRHATGRGSEMRRRTPRRVKATAGLLAVSALALVAAQIVLAAPPTADFTMNGSTAQSITVNVGQSVSLQSTASDDDGDIASQEWDFNYDGNFSADASGPSATRPSGQAGSFSIALKVTDTAGDPNATPPGDGVASEVLRVKTVNVVVPNRNPTASFNFAAAPPHNGNRPVPGQQINFNGTATDLDGDALSYEWNFGDGTSSATEDPSHSYGTAGTKNVTLTVRDNRGGSFTTGAQQVIVNAPPVPNGAVLNNSSEPGQKYNTPLVGQSFVLTPQALPALPGQQALPGSTDAEDGTNVSARWDLDNNGSFEVAGGTGGGCNGCTVHPGFPSPGQRSVGVQVTDSRGAVASRTVSFRVNSAPVPNFSWEPPTPAVAKPIQFSSTSFDPDGPAVDPLTYSWDIDGDGTFGETTPNEQGQNPPPVSFATAGTKAVKLRVTDTGGITREITRQVLVQLSVPNGAFTVSPPSGSPLPGQAVTFTSTSTSSEPTKQITRVEWDFDYDRATGNFTPDATGASVNHAFPTAGSKSVAIRATEGPNGGFDIEPGTVVVNAPPQAGFNVAPESPFVGEPATISSSSLDPDGPLTGQHWDLDGDGAFDDASGPLVFATYSSAGQKTVRLRVTDSRGATAVASGVLNVRTRPLAFLGGVTIDMNGSLRGKITRVKLLRVRAPAGTTVVVSCKGKGCPKKKKKVTKQGKGAPLRFKQFERRFKPGVRIVITVTKPGFLGRHTTYTMRRGAGPKRVDLCLAPGAKKATACPAP